MLATSKGTNADSDEALKAPELAQESVVTVPLILSTSVFPAGSKVCNNHNLIRSSTARTAALVIKQFGKHGVPAIP